MRIAQLDLLAYGPFRGHSLDLSAPGVHVVFGRNEAGKSTTLRAITGLLYGIEARTQDAHVHKMTELRIGGTLVAADGTCVRVVRRKGTANTLLDDQGAAIDEAVLARLLHGVNEHTFKHAFGLDHITLAHGAQALLEGKGDIAGSLFDASIGGGGDVRRLLAQLQEEADAIYKPRGSTQPLTVALKAFADQQKAVREKEQLPAAYVAQQNALAERKDALAKVTKERSDVRARRALLESAIRRGPLERRRATCLATLAQLAAVRDGAARIASLVAEANDHARTRAAQQATALELERLRGRIADAARRAGAPAGTKDLRIDVRVQSRIQKLLQERTRLAQRLDTLRIELERDQRDLARARTEHAPAEAFDEVAFAALGRALDAARKLGDAEGLLARQRAQAARRRADVEERAGALGLFTGGAAELRALRPPATDVLDGFAAAVADLDRRLQRHADRLVELDREAHTIEQQLAQAGGDFAPPTRSDLLAARAARDEAATNVRKAHRSTQGSLPEELARLEALFDAALREADAVADRMIQEADRVLTLSRHQAQRATVAEQRARVAAEHEGALRDRDGVLSAHRGAWAAACVGVGVSELGLAEMRAWLAKREQILELLGAAREAEADADEAAATVAATTAALGAALEAVGEAAGTRTRPLVDLVDLASARRDRAEAARRAATQSAAAITKLDLQLEERRETIARDEAALVEARARLAELLAPLGLTDDADADEVTQGLDALRALFALEDERTVHEANAVAQAAAVAAFEEHAASAAAAFAPDLAGLPAGDVARELGQRRAQVLEAAALLADVEQQLVEAGPAVALPDDLAPLLASLDLARSAVDDASARLDELDEQVNAETQAVARLEVGLEQLQADSGAAEAASRAQEALARARVDLERYVRAKTAATLLAREIERYRAENQGPLLTQASALFARLTLGHFEGVRAGYDDRDKAALRCVRKGLEVDVTGLSEGTRDQLHLSLRLASLLRHAELAEPMPLVLDDLLVQFDDERSAAALAVIGEVSARMQVLFFTHHARMVDLARASIPAASLTVHELASPVGGAVSAAADPTASRSDFA